MNIIEAMSRVKIPRWTDAENIGYEPKTTFWQDFWIANAFGTAEVRDTYERVLEEWQDNVTYMAELTLVLNHMVWWYFQRPNVEQSAKFARLYDALWRDCCSFCADHFFDEDLQLYYGITD